MAISLAIGCADPEAALEPAPRERWLPAPDAGGPPSAAPFDDLNYVSDPRVADAGVEQLQARHEPQATAAFVHVSHDPFARIETRVEPESYESFVRGAAYAVLPPAESVRADSFVNAFDYDYPAPAAGAEHPFHVQLDLADHPLGRMANLLRVSLRAAEVGGQVPAQAVAEDVEVLVEMNPSWVAAYRLVGIAGGAQDESNGRVDGRGTLTAGQRLTALFELVPKGYPIPQPEGVPPSSSGPEFEGPRNVAYGDVARVTVRYRRPDAQAPMHACAAAVNTADVVQEPLAMDDDFLWAAGVAGLAEHLADSPYAGAGERVVIADLLSRAAGDDPAREELLYAFRKIEAQLKP